MIPTPQFSPSVAIAAMLLGVAILFMLIGWAQMRRRG